MSLYLYTPDGLVCVSARTHIFYDYDYYVVESS